MFCSKVCSCCFSFFFFKASLGILLTSINAELLQLQASLTPRPPYFTSARWHPPLGTNHSRPPATSSRCKQFTSDFFIFSVRRACDDPRPRSLQDSNPIKLNLSVHLSPSALPLLSSHLAA